VFSGFIGKAEALMAVLTANPSNKQDWKRQQQLAHRKKFLTRLVLTIATGFVVLIFFYPIWFWFGVSIKPRSEVFTLPPSLTINTFTPAWWSVVIGGRPYAEVIREQQGTVSGTGGAGSTGAYVVPFLLNSALVAGISTFLVIVVATFTAYALSRFNMRRKQNILFFIISTRFMPPMAVVLPLYLMYRELGWLDTRHGLILAYTVMNLPLAILLIKSFFDDVPQDLDDAAMLDGCSRFGAFFRVVVRYVAPGIAAAAVLSLIFAWNEFLFAVQLTRTDTVRTIPVAISRFDSSSGGTEWGFMAAAGSAALAPVFLFILSVQRHLIRGLTLGAVRG
jgi:multiple sugar transport system permease protein